MTRIGPYSFDEYMEVVRRFHGAPSPGVLTGSLMVEIARQTLPQGTLFEALCETRSCLPDAVQMLTPCTTGNGRLRIVHAGRFALTLYDKYTGEGTRAYIDSRKLESLPTIKTWFLKTIPKSEQDSERLMAEIRDSGAEIISTYHASVDLAMFKKSRLGPVRPCPSCGEYYPNSSGEVCLGCNGGLPYRSSSDRQSAAGVPV